MEILNIERYKIHGNAYGGCIDNRSYLLDNKLYLLKTNKLKKDYGPESALTYHRQSIASEYVCCKSLESIIDIQKVLLGICEDIMYILCEDFKNDNEVIIELRSESSRDTLEERKFVNDFNKYISTILLKKVPNNIKEDLRIMYIRLAIFDYLFANPDRHLGNIAYLLNKKTGISRIAPAYDFGAGLGSSIRINRNVNELLKSASINNLLVPMQTFNNVKITDYNVLHNKLPYDFYNEAEKIALKTLDKNIANNIEDIVDNKIVSQERGDLMYAIFSSKADILESALKLKYNVNLKSTSELENI